MKKLFFRILILSLILFVSACSSKKKDEPKELVKKEYSTIDASQEELFNSGKNYYAKKLFSISSESFSSLQNIYPVGPYREFSEIKLADARFYSHDYSQAAPLYESFVRDHPTSKACPYALLMAGRSYELSYGGLGRDTSPLDNALKSYKLLDKQYPYSPYAVKAKALQKNVLEALLAKQEAIIEFYQKQDLTVAADARIKEIHQKMQPEINEIQKDEITAVAKRKEESSKQKNKVTKLAQEQTPPKTVVKNGLYSSNSVYDQKNDKLQFMSCQRGMIIFNIKDTSILPALTSFKTLTSKNGEAVLNIPNGNFASHTINKNCFAHNDLLISNDRIALKTKRQIAVIILEKPARLLLLPE